MRGQGEKEKGRKSPWEQTLFRAVQPPPLWHDADRAKNNARLQALNHMTAVERSLEIRCKKKEIVAEDFCGVEFTGRERKEQEEGDRRLGHIFEAVDVTARKHGDRRQFAVQVPHKSKSGCPTALKHGSECRDYVPTSKEAV